MDPTSRDWRILSSLWFSLYANRAPEVLKSHKTAGTAYINGIQFIWTKGYRDLGSWTFYVVQLNLSSDELCSSPEMPNVKNGDGEWGIL